MYRPAGSAPTRIFTVQELWQFRETFTEPLSDLNFDAKLRKPDASAASSGAAASMMGPETLVTSDKGYRRLEASTATKSQVLIRNVQAVLNKLTHKNYDTLVPPLQMPAIFAPDAIEHVVGRIYEKSLDEPVYAERYAQMCHDLTDYEFTYLQGGKTFRSELLKKAQNMFEADAHEAASASASAVASTSGQTDDVTNAESMFERIRKRKINNIRFVGHLYRKQLLADRVVATIMSKLLFEPGTSEAFRELNAELAISLLDNIGEMLEGKSKKPDTLVAIFQKIEELRTSPNVGYRIKVLAMNLLELRQKNWVRPSAVEKDDGEEMIAESKRLATTGSSSDLSGSAAAAGGGAGADRKDFVAWWPIGQPDVTPEQRASVIETFTAIVAKGATAISSPTAPADLFSKFYTMLAGQHPTVNAMVCMSELFVHVTLKTDETLRASLALILRTHDKPMEAVCAASWALQRAIDDGLTEDCPLFFQRLSQCLLAVASKEGSPQLHLLRDLLSRTCHAVDVRKERRAKADDDADVSDSFEEELVQFWETAIKQLKAVSPTLTHGGLLNAMSQVANGPTWRMVLPDCLSALTASGCCTMQQLTTWRSNHLTDPKYADIVSALEEILGE